MKLQLKKNELKGHLNNCNKGLEENKRVKCFFKIKYSC